MSPPAADFARGIRRLVLEQSKRADVGHIGSALSIADIVAVCLRDHVRVPAEQSADRDRFILSKGHAALALYAALRLQGRLSDEQLATYCADRSLLGVHPESELAGVDFSTGSLGHGLPMAAGAALAARLQGSQRRVFVLMSDAECDEGSVWEAAMFAAHHGLSNLVAIVDANGQQALGYTRDVLDLGRLEEKWTSFGWAAQVVPGNDVGRLDSALAQLDTARPGQPNVLIAQTEFGHGVSFMTSRIEWHYLPMNDQQFEAAMAEIDRPA